MMELEKLRSIEASIEAEPKKLVWALSFEISWPIDGFSLLLD